MRVAGVELGGTKTVVVAGSGGQIEQRTQFPTTAPAETLAQVTAALHEFDAASALKRKSIRT